MRVELVNPQRYWLAVRDDMPALQDPDVEDQCQRWPDRDERDWAGIAAAVQHVMDELAQGRGRVELVDEDDPDTGEHVVLDADLDHLDTKDQDIVSEWFWEALRPTADPWSDSVQDGRHRLWNCWRVAPDAVLPVHSVKLQYLDDIPHMGEDFGVSYYRGVMEGMELIPPTVVKRNPTFSAELCRVASLGGHHDVMPSRRWSAGGRDVYDTVADDPDLLPHLFAGVPVHRHEPSPPAGREQGTVAVQPVRTPWWRRILGRPSH